MKRQLPGLQHQLLLLDKSPWNGVGYDNFGPSSFLNKEKLNAPESQREAHLKSAQALLSQKHPPDSRAAEVRPLNLTFPKQG